MTADDERLQTEADIRQEEAELLTFASLLKGQKEIADRMHKDRIVGALVIVLLLLVLSVFGFFISSNSQTAGEAKTAAAKADAAASAAQIAKGKSDQAEEDQAVVSCNDANKNRKALTSLFDFIDELARKQEAATGQPESASIEQLVAFGRSTFAQRDCAQEAADRAASTTTTTKPGG